MASGIKLEGLEKALSKLNTMPKAIQDKVGHVIGANCQTIVRNMKVDAPKDLGFLVNGISFFESGPISFELVSAASYSPYMEFGTGTSVQVPAGLEEYALRFKGKGKRLVNILPHPYFFPNILKQTPIMIKEIKQVLEGKI